MRLYPKYKLDDAVAAPLTKSEARARARADFRTGIGIFQIVMALLISGFIAIFGAMAHTLLGFVMPVLMFVMLLYSFYDSRVSYYSNLTLYSELDDHRKELEEFLKEKGFI